MNGGFNKEITYKWSICQPCLITGGYLQATHLSSQHTLKAIYNRRQGTKIVFVVWFSNGQMKKPAMRWCARCQIGFELFLASQILPTYGGHMVELTCPKSSEEARDQSMLSCNCRFCSRSSANSDLSHWFNSQKAY